MTFQSRFKPDSGRVMLVSMVLVLILFGACDSNRHTPPQDRGDWINPADMINYDSSTKTMVKSSKPSDDAVAEEMPVVNCDEVLKPCIQREKDKNKELEICKENLQKCLENEPVSHAPFFKQFTKHFVKKIKPAINEHDISHFNAHIQLRGKDLANLNHFTFNDDVSPQTTHEILTTMITEFTYLKNYQEPTLNDMIGEFFGGCQNIVILSLCIVSVVWLCTSAVKIHLNYGYSYSYIFLILVMFMFVISVPWNWWHLYKKKVAERQAANINQIPDECLGGKKTTAQTFFDALLSLVIFQDDKCVKFHESLLIDPIWEVPPTKAIAVTVTKFILEPLEHIGQGVSLLIRSMLQDLPLTVWPIALLILFIFVLLVMAMTSGYRINFFHLIQLGPGERQPEAIAPNADGERVQELTSRVSDLTRRLEAAETERVRLEYTRTEGRVMVVGPALPALPSAADEPGSSGASQTSRDKASSKNSPKEVVEHLVSSSGDFAEPELISGRAIQEISKKKTPVVVSDEQGNSKDDTEDVVKTPITSITAKLNPECTESGTDSDIEIISQDDMNKL